MVLQTNVKNCNVIPFVVQTAQKCKKLIRKCGQGHMGNLLTLIILALMPSNLLLVISASIKKEHCTHCSFTGRQFLLQLIDYSVKARFFHKSAVSFNLLIILQMIQNKIFFPLQIYFKINIFRHNLSSRRKRSVYIPAIQNVIFHIFEYFLKFYNGKILNQLFATLDRISLYLSPSYSCIQFSGKMACFCLMLII